MLSLWSNDSSTTVRLWSLTDDALVEGGAEPGTLVVVTRWGERTVVAVSAVSAESLRRMAFGPVALHNALPPGDGTAAAAELERVIDLVGCAVVHSVGLPDGQQPLLSVEPVVDTPLFRLAPVLPTARVRLPRIAVLRPEGDDLVLEVPGAPFRVLLRQPLARALATALCVATVPGDLARSVGAPLPVVLELLAFLVASGAVQVAAADGTFATDPALRGWSSHELVFQRHSRSRAVRPDDDGDRGLPPVVRPLPAGPRFPLPRPDLAARAATDPTLTALLESDHVCPDLAGAVLTAEQVGELLYRGARVRSTGPAHLPSPGGGPSHEASQRPYANIACLYELEVYLTLDRCAGLPSGLFHYDPLGHALTRIDADPAHVGTVLDVGRVAAGSAKRPAMVLTITARIGRLSWILPGASLAVALTHCGALQQTIYLVAKAMGLWAHAVPADGTGPDRLLGLEWPAEVGLAECVVDLLPDT